MRREDVGPDWYPNFRIVVAKQYTKGDRKYKRSFTFELIHEEDNYITWSETY